MPPVHPEGSRYLMEFNGHGRARSPAEPLGDHCGLYQQPLQSDFARHEL